MKIVEFHDSDFRSIRVRADRVRSLTEAKDGYGRPLTRIDVDGSTVTVAERVDKVRESIEAALKAD